MVERVGPLSVLLDRPCVVCQVRLRDHTAEQTEACCEVVEGWLRPAVPYSQDSPAPQRRSTDDAGATTPGANPVYCGKQAPHYPHVVVPGSSWCDGQGALAADGPGDDQREGGSDEASSDVVREEARHHAGVAGHGVRPRVEGSESTPRDRGRESESAVRGVADDVGDDAYRLTGKGRFVNGLGDSIRHKYLNDADMKLVVDKLYEASVSSAESGVNHEWLDSLKLAREQGYKLGYEDAQRDAASSSAGADPSDLVRINDFMEWLDKEATLVDTKTADAIRRVRAAAVFFLLPVVSGADTTERA